MSTNNRYYAISIPPFIETISFLLKSSSRSHPFFLHAHVIRIDIFSLFDELKKEGDKQNLCHRILTFTDQDDSSRSSDYYVGEVTFFLTCIEDDLVHVENYIRSTFTSSKQISFRSIEEEKQKKQEEERNEEEEKDDYSDDDLTLSEDVLAMIKELQT